MNQLWELSSVLLLDILFPGFSIIYLQIPFIVTENNLGLNILESTTKVCRPILEIHGVEVLHDTDLNKLGRFYIVHLAVLYSNQI